MRRKKDSSLNGFWMRIVLCLIALSSSSAVLVAQQTPDKPAPSTESQDVKPAILAMPSYSQNIALLGTDQRYMDLGTLEARRRTFFMYGMGISESYADSPGGNSGGQEGNQLLGSGHFAIVNASSHSSFSFQYAPSVVQSTSGPPIREVFHAGTISFGQPIARNWAMQLSSSDTYGTDLARLLSPLAFDVNKGVPVVDPSSAVFQFNRGKVFQTSNSVGFSWQRSPSQSLNFSVGESYFSSLDAGISNSSAVAHVSYSAAVSPLTSFIVGGNYYHRVFSLASCDGYGFNLGISHQFGRYINLTIAAGPEFETSPCNKGLSGNYEIYLSYPLSRKSRVALSAGRAYTTDYLANTQWSDTAAVSFARQISEAFTINLNSGYARSVLVQTSLGTYVGYFAEGSLSWKLSRTVALATAYRRFEQVSGGPIQARQNIGMISLAWNPLPVRIVK